MLPNFNHKSFSNIFNIKRCLILLILFCLISQSVFARTVRNREKPSNQGDIFFNFLTPGINVNWHTTFLGKIYLGTDFKINFVYATSAEKDFPLRYEFFFEIGIYENLWGSGQNQTLNDYFYTYLFGGNISFNRTKSLSHKGAHYLIPYLGLRIGGLYHNLNRKAGLLAMPSLGISFITTETYSISFETGLLLNSSNFLDLFGVTPKLTFQYSF